MSMRGLTVFIADLRKCQSREEEERRVNKELGNIRAHFNESTLNGYNRKKYVSKLLYMLLLGYDVNFGHREALDLIQSTKFTEKYIGYLAITLLLNEKDSFTRLLVNSIRKDLFDPSEITTCLALHAIANIGSQEMAEALSGDVFSILVSTGAGPFSRKKAALCLLRLVRKCPEIVDQRRWIRPTLQLMLHSDLGVATSVASLVTTLVQQCDDETIEARKFAIQRLHHIIIDREFTHDHVYYRVPAPWLQIKLFRLLQYFPAPSEPHLQDMITGAIRGTILAAQEVPPDVQQVNAQNAILFEAINLAIHLDLDRKLLSEAAQLLGRFVSSRETNVRYLGLETMSHLAAYVDYNTELKKYHPVIVQSLRDRDVSVRRRALDLMYSMCSISNAKGTVMELLRHMPSADPALREEMALKIAILTERYATEYSWYVDVMMRLIATAGSHMGDEVWYRVVQVVLGNEDLQAYAVSVALQTLKAPVCHDNAFKVCAYILGEFGHLIANNEGCSPLEQLTALQNKMKTGSLVSRAVALTTVGKLANLFPEIKPQCLRLLDQYRSALDSELQQRACEYHALIARDNDELLQTVFEEIPPFPERQSALMSRLLKREADTEDRRTWVHGGKVANRERRNMLTGEKAGGGKGGARPAFQNNDGATDSLFSTDDEGAGGTRGGEQRLPTNAEADLLQLHDDEPLVEGVVDATLACQPHYDRLLWNRSGILYNDTDIQIGLTAIYKPPTGRVAIYIGNKTPHPITELLVTADHEPLQGAPTKTADGELAINIALAKDGGGDADSQQNVGNAASGLPAPMTIAPLSQVRVIYDLCCLGLFTPTLGLRVDFNADGRRRQLSMPLPVVLLHFIEPVSISAPDFFHRWRQLGIHESRESQMVFRTDQGDVNDAVIEWSHRVLDGLNLAKVDNADPSPDNRVAVGILTTKNEGRFGCLVRLEASKEHGMYRLTVRATHPTVVEAVSRNIRRLVEAGPDSISE